jgi:predicted DNA-binding WGR domain protein
VKWNESVGQTRIKEFRTRDRAVSAYHKAIAEKLSEGYRESYGRAVVIAPTPESPKRPGKKKSR